MLLRSNIPLSPVVGFFLVASLFGSLLVQLDPRAVLWEYLLFMPINYSAAGWIYESQYWRLLTPIFLHFGLAHIAFNGLMLWILGSAIEKERGSMLLLLLLSLGSIVANMVQYYVSGSVLFGGLSGGVFALISYILFNQYRYRNSFIAIPPALLWLSVLSMMLGFIGVLDFIIGGKVANAAHIAGFIFGALFMLLEAVFFALLKRLNAFNSG